MKLQMKLALTLITGSLLLGGAGTTFGAEDTIMKKPIPASSMEIQSPELQKADVRIDDAKAQLELARKQLRASQALLKAAEADLRAAESDRKAIALKNHAQTLAEDAQLPMAVPNKTQVAVKPPKDASADSNALPSMPTPGTEARTVDFSAEPIIAEPAVATPAPSNDIPQLR